MKNFPLFHRTEGRTILVIGGGEQAAQKARLLLRTEAALRFISPTLDDELQSLVDSGRAEHEAIFPSHSSFQDADLAFIATGCPAGDVAAHALAKSAGVLVNVVDSPALCDVVMPSIVDRDPVVVAIGTEGTAPVLGRRIKTGIETLLEPNIGALAALSGRLRGAVAKAIPRTDRRRFWSWVFSGPVGRDFAENRLREGATALKTAISEWGESNGESVGSISLVGAGPGAADLLTLRAVRRLQEADIIYYDRLVGREILDLARRDAERVFVGKEVGACAWPQDRINQVILSAARQGKQVVRLKSGDPGIFGRAEEELSAARESGISIEIIPGITAASAVSAGLGRSLTERGKTDRVVFATATSREGDADPCITDLAKPGTTLALYMAVSKAPIIQRQLRAAGWPGSTQVDVVASATAENEIVVNSSLGEFVIDMANAGIGNPAIIFVRLNKDDRINRDHTTWSFHPSAQPLHEQRRLLA